jgi:predicted porin
MHKFAMLAGLALAPVFAAAQSSVSLYGVVDVGVRHVSNGGASVNSLSSNGNNTSRIGLKGIEDLGDGFKAGFQLESGLSPDTGTSSDATRFWNRRSTVSLLGRYGELRLGRDYSVTYLGYEDYDVWSDIGVSSVVKFDTSLGSSRDTGVRADNQVAYFTPGDLGGFYARAALAAGEGTSGGKYAAARLGYAAGPVDLSLSYGVTNVVPVAGDERFRTFDAGAAYDFGAVKLSGYLARSRFAGLAVANAYLGAQVPLGAGLVRASWLHSNRSGTTSLGVDTQADDASQFALGYLYNLSRRTAAYAAVARVDNQGASAIAVDKNPALAAGKDSTGVEIGLRHFF